MSKEEDLQILVLAGYSAAGKSTLGRQLRDSWGYELIEHQGLVHSIAVRHGFERARYWLESVGIDKFAEESLLEIVEKVNAIQRVGGNKIVIDVSYGKKMLEVLESEFPGLGLLVVSVIAERKERRERIGIRMNANSIQEAVSELNFRDGFLREVGLDEVLAEADIQLVNQGRPEEVVCGLIKRIEMIKK